MIPTPRLWLTICLLAIPAMLAGFIAGMWPFILAMDAVVVVAAGVDAVLARRERLDVARVIPDKLDVGVAATIRLSLHSHARRQLRVQVTDDVPEGLTCDAIPLELSLPPESRSKLRYAVTPSRRGRFEFGALTVRVLGPLGLFWHERRIAAPGHATVFPDLRGARRLLLSGAVVDWVNLGLRALRRDGQGSEFARLRDYAQGDSVREVDWKATARRGRPVTRVREAERAQSVVLCVDQSRAMAAQVDGLTRLDHAVNAALFLAFVAVRNGDRVGLVLFSDGIKAVVPPATGRGQYRRIVDALYSATPQLTAADHGALFRELMVRIPRRSLVAVFTEVGDEEQGANLGDPLRLLSRKHLPICFTVQDTGLVHLLRTPPQDPDEAFERAAASEVLSERDRVRWKLGRAGVPLVDAAPDALSLMAVNRYLDVKARGLL